MLSVPGVVYCRRMTIGPPDDDAPARVQVVVPCYNEAGRWNWDYWRDVFSIPDIEWLFVNDGSTDGTQGVLDEITRTFGQPNLGLTPNRGKAEAVRLGMLEALGSGVEDGSMVGFMDADGSVAKSEVERFVRLARSQRMRDYDSIWASRVALSGRHVIRTPRRHYIGRVVCTVLTVGYPEMPYDSQCGFKFFKTSPTLLETISRPFETRWFIDIEMLQNWKRITGTPMRVWEEPLQWWEDMEGSHISTGGYVSILKDMTSVIRKGRALEKRRRTASA